MSTSAATTLDESEAVPPTPPIGREDPVSLDAHSEGSASTACSPFQEQLGTIPTTTESMPSSDELPLPPKVFLDPSPVVCVLERRSRLLTGIERCFVWVYRLCPLVLCLILLYLPSICELLPPPFDFAARKVLGPLARRHMLSPSSRLPPLHYIPTVYSRSFDVPIHDEAFDPSSPEAQTLEHRLLEDLGMGDNGHANETVQSARLRAHGAQFAPRRIEVLWSDGSDRMIVGLGFGLANVVVLEVGDTAVFIDSFESRQVMHEFLEEWKKQLREEGRYVPRVSALVYTHFHTDHVGGAYELSDEKKRQDEERRRLAGDASDSNSNSSNDKLEVWAHRATATEIDKVFRVTAGSTFRRSLKQFGNELPRSRGFLNAGIGPQLFFGADSEVTVLPPTNVWDGERLRVTVGGGIEVELILAPGESKDQTLVWFERGGVLMGADNLYKAFPNLYAIRGTESRNAKDWVNSLELMRSLKAKVLVLGHTQPVYGVEEITSLLSAYRDAIVYVHDQTVRLMNRGIPINDVASLVRLPPYLADHPYLQEFYGRIPWAVRSVFCHYLGWFSGSAEDLNPLTSMEKALEIQALAGGFSALLNAAWSALQEGRFQWGLELATHAHLLQPDSRGAKFLRVAALRGMASRETAAAGRNWYLSTALEIEAKDGKHPTMTAEEFEKRLQPGDRQRADVLYSFKSGLDILDFLTTNYKSELAMDITQEVLFSLTDSGAKVCWHIRRGVFLYSSECEGTPSLKLSMTETAWRQLVVGEGSAWRLLATGALKVDGPWLEFIRLFSFFEQTA